MGGFQLSRQLIDGSEVKARADRPGGSNRVAAVSWRGCKEWRAGGVSCPGGGEGSRELAVVACGREGAPLDGLEAGMWSPGCGFEPAGMWSPGCGFEPAGLRKLRLERGRRVLLLDYLITT